MYKQAVRRAHGELLHPDNALGVCVPCHGAHHNRKAVIKTAQLRDENLHFIVELLGPCAALVYLETYYDAATTEDPRVVEIAARCGE